MKIDFYTTDWCGDCVRSKALLNRLDVNFNEINVDVNQEANEYIKSLQFNQRRIPTIVFDDGSFLVEPSDIELENKLNNQQSSEGSMPQDNEMNDKLEEITKSVQKLNLSSGTIQKRFERVEETK